MMAAGPSQHDRTPTEPHGSVPDDVPTNAVTAEPPVAAAPMLIEYASPGTARPESRETPVGDFIIGMVLAFLGGPAAVMCGGVTARSEIAILIVLIYLGAPILMLFHRQSRMVGAGWLSLVGM